MPVWTPFQDLFTKLHPYRPAQIGALSADEMAASATVIFKKSGRSTLGAKCVYRALELESHQPEALLRLSDFFRAEKRGEGAGSFAYAASALRRAQQSADKKGALGQEIESAYLRLLWEGKFAVYKKDPAAAFPADFVHPDDFEVNELAYATAMSTEVQRIGSPEKVFELIHRAIGIKAGLLQPKKRLWRRPAPAGPPPYEHSPDYFVWLRSDVRTLAAYGR